MIGAVDDCIFQRVEREEIDSPSESVVHQKHPHPWPIHPSRGDPRSIEEALGKNVLGDFGSARLLKSRDIARGWAMPDTYRAPEILLGAPWDHVVDVWSVGVTV
jgi:serine/threonine-protein kinase SRPK3